MIALPLSRDMLLVCGPRAAWVVLFLLVRSFTKGHDRSLPYVCFPLDGDRMNLPIAL